MVNCAAALAACVGSVFAVKKTEVRGLWQGLRRKMRCRALLQADLQGQDKKISPEKGTEISHAQDVFKSWQLLLLIV